MGRNAHQAAKRSGILEQPTASTPPLAKSLGDFNLEGKLERKHKDLTSYFT